MVIPDELQAHLVVPARSGAQVISSTRAVMYYLGDELVTVNAPLIEPFQSIDSQTDHVELDHTWPFPLPSPRVSLTGESRYGRLLGSAERPIVSPMDATYDRELEEILEYFGGTYGEAVAALLGSA